MKSKGFEGIGKIVTFDDVRKEERQNFIKKLKKIREGVRVIMRAEEPIIDAFILMKKEIDKLIKEYDKAKIKDLKK